MSYILDALRRAERERDTGKAPSVESLNRGVTEVDRARVPPSVWILAIATTVIAGAALAILLWPHTPPSSAQGEAPPTPRPVVRATRSEEHTSELQSLMRISYAVFCLKKKTPQSHYNSKY